MDVTLWKPRLSPDPPTAEGFLDQLEPLKESLERFAFRNAWNRSQAIDIVQEAVMTAWREYHRFRQGTDFRAWLFRILVNTIYSFNKKVARQKRHTSSVGPEGFDSVLEREETWTSILEHPEKIIDSLDDRLARAVGGLGLDERQCLLLRIVEEFTYQEISSMLNMPMGTVMSHVFRARMKLRERLSDMASELGLVKGSIA